MEIEKGKEINARCYQLPDLQSHIERHFGLLLSINKPKTAIDLC